MRICGLGFVLFFMFLSHAQAAKMCVVPKAVTKGLRQQVSGKEYLDFYPGEELVLISTNNRRKQAVVALGENKYTVSTKDLSRRKKNFCGLTTCVRLKNKNQYYKSPNEYDTSGTIADGVYPLLTRSGNWYRVQTNENFVWISSAQMHASKVDCDAPTTTEVSEALEASSMIDDPEEVELKKNLARYRWRYGIEAGWIANTSSKPLENLLSARPSGSTAVNTDGFDSPFIEQVSGGMGWFVGLTLEASLWWDLKAKYSVGYKQRSIDVVSRPNPPATGTVTYDQLGRDEYTEDFGFLYFNTVIKHDGIKLLGLQWQPGINLGVDYSTDLYTQEFQTAPNKLTIFTVDSGFDTFEFYYGPRIDVIWRSLSFGVVVNFSQYDIEPTAVVGFQF